MTTGARRGRPSGLVANPDAFADVLGDKSQRWLATAVPMSPSHLNEILAGRKGVTEDVATKMAVVLGCRIGTLFPQRATFRVEAKVFTVSGEAA